MPVSSATERAEVRQALTLLVDMRASCGYALNCLLMMPLIWKALVLHPQNHTSLQDYRVLQHRVARLL